jgi:hypothetical protein
MAIAARSHQAPGRARRYFAYKHGRADHQQHPRCTGNHVQGDLLSAEQLMAGGFGCGVCHVVLLNTQVIGAIDWAQIVCSALAAAE